MPLEGKQQNLMLAISYRPSSQVNPFRVWRMLRLGPSRFGLPRSNSQNEQRLWE